MQVTFAVNSMTGDTECIIITGTPDSVTEGNEFIRASIRTDTAFAVNGTVNGDTAFLDINITDNDAGTYMYMYM